MKKFMRWLVVSVAILWMLAGVAFADDSARGQGQHQERAQTEESIGSTLTVIGLKWANAEELAATLAPILPEGFKLVPYPPLNALIIVWDPVAPKR